MSEQISGKVSPRSEDKPCIDRARRSAPSGVNSSEVGEKFSPKVPQVMAEFAAMSRRSASTSEHFVADLYAPYSRRIALGALSTGKEIAPVALTRAARVEWFFVEVRVGEGRPDTH